MTFKDFFSLKRNRFFWLNIIGMVIFITAAIQTTLWWMDVYTRHGEAHVVPNVKSQTLIQAQDLLRRAKIKGVVVDSSYVKGTPAGIILEQTPAAGMKVKEGRTIYLTINTSEAPLVKIPDIIDNSSARQAEAKLKAMGFKLTEPELVPGESDWIYGIKYRGKSLRAGDKVPHEALLTLCIGNAQMRELQGTDSLGIQTDTTTEQPAAEIDDSWF